jgi:vancomycin resistance protein VanJ
VKFVGRLVAVATWGYLATIVVYWGALRFIGEGWWVTTGMLYLPHVMLLVPALPLVALLAVRGPRSWIAAPVAAAAIVLVPIMGLVVFGGAEAPSGSPRLRLLSYNIDSGRRSVDELVAQIRDVHPDVVVLQEGDEAVGERVTAELTGFARHASGQFYLASRWPIVDVFEPPKIHVRDADRTPRFVRYTLATPLGPLDVFVVHPVSPRDGFEAHNIELRRAQAEAIVALARTSTHRVILAGDTNLPQGSRIFADTFGHYRDGFAEVGRGFGYTYPAHKRFAWMRIDRILAGPGLRFLDFGVGTRHGSDHYCVWADLERWP